MRRPFVAVGLACAALAAAGASADPTLVETRRIWNEAPHCAFTDLIRFKDRWRCAFREASSHHAPDGVIRVLTSPDGTKWRSDAVLKRPGHDLRDPKLSVMPDGRLMMVGAVARAADGVKPKDHWTFVAFSKDGSTWSDPARVLESWQWLWGVTWHERTAYGVVYQWDPKAEDDTSKYRTFLVRSRDGLAYEKVVDFDVLNATEGTLEMDGETMVCLLRRDGSPDSAQLGTSRPPYDAWTWTDLKQFVGGPAFLHLPDGSWVAAGRMMREGKPKTVLCALDLDEGTLRPLVTLPSGGDTGYPGMAWHERQIWLTYYSSHETGTSVYFARFRLEAP